MADPRVFLTNAVAKIDLAPARRFGKIVTINRSYVYGDEIDATLRVPDHFRDALSEAARRFDPKQDYLLLAGDHLQVACLAAMLGKQHGHFKVLRYDRIAGGYIEVLVG